MAEEMVLIPRVRYERLLTMDTNPPTPQVNESKGRNEDDDDKKLKEGKKEVEKVSKEGEEKDGASSSEPVLELDHDKKSTLPEVSSGEKSNDKVEGGSSSKMEVEVILSEIPSKY
jgi:hypothetical protein